MKKFYKINESKENNDKPHSVTEFENITNKEFPYYQKGSKYACCEFCGSVVSITNGANNSSCSNATRAMYAKHTSLKDGLPFDPDYKNCIGYSGNAGGWQQIFTQEKGVLKNQKLENYINSHKVDIAKELFDLIGIRFSNTSGVNNLFNEMYESFTANKGLYVKKWYPSTVPFLLMQRTSNLNFWGYIVNDAIVQELKNEGIEIDGNQFKESDYQISFDLNKDDFPTHIIVRLLDSKGNFVDVSKCSLNKIFE
ncbi:hypothetical protein DN392_26360 [Bacillus sp. BB51/4]|uniref:hypothetical protein n=1 Tax=Bacillus cereus group TaxID=86661 RepID=UPI000B4ACBD2|nr:MULTISPECIES: hypothetical protein [Bacillus cereus group]KAA0769295.1 hypothetical protein DN392_26360 [Bacillus sp. BB51/4]